MSDTMIGQRKSVVILGASFATGNLGVGALAWSTLKLIKCKWPDAGITVVGVGREPGVATVRLDGRTEKFSTWPVRYCPNVLARHHIAELWGAVLVCRLFPILKKWLFSTRSVASELLRCDLVCDITGGDSFSDLYGLSRFIRGYLLKKVCQLTGKPFVLLPQTYGPFASSTARFLAKDVLTHSRLIFSRDREGLTVVQELIGSSTKIALQPDVAFIMDAIRPESVQVEQLEQLRAAGHRLIGLNISGLLYNGGYSRQNMFGLTCDYPALVKKIISFFVGPGNQYVLLVPHVVPPAFAVEDDAAVISEIVKTLPAEERDKVIVLGGGLDQNETKYCIGLCDFFLGARMHAAIAALSQCVPAVGMAYSRKFAGVFATAGVEECVLDLRSLTNEEIMDGIEAIFARRDELRLVLAQAVPKLKESLLHLFDELDGMSGQIT